ncbi:hypothetical protein ONS95_008330 [Cadophora gregata]|uniref:uncharacterized protein n=1 Tax=Cadophora gregata TaxID=51156 RepID=UPI0026DCF78A|nr:uncharacterized protein ONS95_008330 [Cadophora gregata]KAK0100376.1 hypothetical protein ONS96_007656 [Cadophora gregata f. sp. sojae]KAK0126750.1 hypothetical protein ONS95_008330 [Cadophora gregata]
MEATSTTIWDGMLGAWQSHPDHGRTNQFETTDEEWLRVGIPQFANQASETQMFAPASYSQHMHTHSNATPTTLTYEDLPPYLIEASHTSGMKEGEGGTHHIQTKSRRGKGGTDSASDRRRAQVRLAQQAYRQRQEAAVTSLERQVSDLRARLKEVQATFDRFHDLADSRDGLRNDPELSKHLEHTAEQIKLVIAMPSQSREGEISARVSEDVRTSAHRESLSGSEPNALSMPGSSGGASSPDTTSPKPNLWASPRTLNVSDESLSIELPFSTQLRNAALLNGYHLISNKSTPYPILCKGFRFCIFHSTRDDIARHIQELLEESNTSITEGITEESVRKSASHVLRKRTLSRSTKISEDAEPCTTGGAGEPQTNLQDDSAEYVDSEAVQRYLVRKGIDIQPGVGAVTLQMPSKLESDDGKTLFRELFGDNSVTLSTSKHLYELVHRAVCLSFGPGIRPKDIDEAVRSTMLAAV